MQQSEEKVQESMGLYRGSKARQILTDAVMIAYKHQDKTCPAHFEHLDNLHYLGTKALGEFAKSIALTTRHKVLDVGGGVGGPSRFLAHSHPGLKVISVEFLENLCNIGRILNKLSLQDPNSVEFIKGDFTLLDLKKHGIFRSCDVLISQLCFLHIPNKEGLFYQCGQSLKSNGNFYIEDFYLRDGHEFHDEDLSLLQNSVSVPSRNCILSKEEYISYLEKNGLIVDEWCDETEAWTEFVWQRYENFLAGENETLGIHGPDYVDEVGEFYFAMTKLYRSASSEESNERLHRTCPRVSQKHGGVRSDFSLQALGGVKIIGHKKVLEG